MKKPDLNVIVGDWSVDTIQIDLDKTSFDEAVYWGYRACIFFKLQGFLVLESSCKNHVIRVNGRIIHRWREASHHIVFNRKARDWTENVHVMAWLAYETKNSDLTNWFTMQAIKESSTLRISKKGKKPTPKIVYRYGEQDGEIKDYLENRKLILQIIKSLKEEKKEVK